MTRAGIHDEKRLRFVRKIVFVEKENIRFGASALRNLWLDAVGGEGKGLENSTS
jgi:hypothetical protein